MESLWNLIAGVFGAIWGLIAAVLLFGFETLHWLHFDAPRLEGLLVGVLLAWLLSRRESHPLIKLASAPLKLILDILDLAWDRGLEAVAGLWSHGKSYAFKSIGWVSDKVKSGYLFVMKKLNIIKDDLK